MTPSFRLEDAESHQPVRVPAALVRAGTLVLGLGFYLFLGALFIHCGIIDMSAKAWVVMRRGVRLA